MMPKNESINFELKLDTSKFEKQLAEVEECFPETFFQEIEKQERERKKVLIAGALGVGKKEIVSAMKDFIEAIKGDEIVSHSFDLMLEECGKDIWKEDGYKFETVFNEPIISQSINIPDFKPANEGVIFFYDYGDLTSYAPRFGVENLNHPINPKIKNHPLPLIGYDKTAFHRKCFMCPQTFKNLRFK